MSIKEIEAGFTWAEGDRYSLAACAIDPGAIRAAACLEREPFHHAPEFVKATMKRWAVTWFDSIPIPIIFCDKEPYDSLASMQADVNAGFMRVRGRKTGHVAGRETQKWRAVHDYFGHCLLSAPFTLSGELVAYGRAVGQFPEACHPYIWNNVFLENAFRLNRGHFLCWPAGIKQCGSKFVWDQDMFGHCGKFYSRF